MRRILIIDDSEDVENLIRFCTHSYWPEAILEMYDPSCGIPESDFAWKNYDLLLLDHDLSLPDETGLDWLKQLKKRPNLPATIFITGIEDKRLAAKAHKFGADDFIEKRKLTPQIFSDCVKRVLRINGSDEGDVDDDQGEKTQFLSPEEKNALLGRVKGDSTSEEEGFEKTQLLSGNEVLSVLNRESGEDDDGRASTASSTNANKDQTARRRKTFESIQESGPKTRTPTSVRTTTSHRRGQRSAEDIAFEVPGYYVEKKIGEGGMAAIYLAERDEDQLKVVLKVLTLKEKGDSTLLRRFMREYKMIAQIHHPNIVQIHERAFASNFAYIAMEYFSHGTLTERLNQGLDTKAAIHYLHQITEGLGAAHAKGIVHRDMKPANILFRSPDNLAITDFGIAKVTEADNQEKQLTMDGQLMGTLYYISPEQIEGEEADQRSDLYSLGIIMYKMLTGKHPYVGATPTEVFQGHLSAPIPLLPDEFASLQPLLNGLLAKDPDERFQSTDELLMGLNWKEWD